MKRKVIIDTDPGIDDSLAIMMALASPEIEVIGITLVAGNTPVEMGFENAKKVLKHVGRLDIPVFKGADKPLKKEFVSALDTHGEDGLGESFLETVEGYEQELSALEFLEQTLEKESVDVIAIGPLTNFAQLLEKNETAFNNIGRFVSMGGTYKSHGNCSPVAEYNYWEDPDAASIVYAQMSKIHKKIEMVGLDVTRKIVLTPTLLEYIKRLDKETGTFIQQITKFYFDFHWEWEHIIGCVINDPLAIAYYLQPDLCTSFESYVQVETESISRGQTLVDAYSFYKQEANAKICTQVDVKEFYYMFLERVLHKTREELDILEEILR
ncbi:MAG: nucleoside hydrolase [Bacillota bacterium]|nr:nucleoside hydrolase [Bacillota bacterium]